MAEIAEIGEMTEIAEMAEIGEIGGISARRHEEVRRRYELDCARHATCRRSEVGAAQSHVRVLVRVAECRPAPDGERRRRFTRVEIAEADGEQVR